MAELAKNHGMEMFGIGDEEHIKAMMKIKALMDDPEAMEEWMLIKQKEFDALPEDRG
ncbi:hypothetical protein ACFLRF_04895 [Candidatus Altiarchaeota archaeon]